MAGSGARSSSSGLRVGLGVWGAVVVGLGVGWSMRVWAMVALLAVLAPSATTSSSSSVNKPQQNGLEESPLTVVYAVESGRVLLPCDVAPPIPTDDTILVLFYHGDIGTPIYSIDGRSGPIKRAPHWSDEQTLGTRAYFDMGREPPGLVLQPVEANDDAEYRCRVDFRSSPTRNVRIQLEVIVPPKRIRIVSEAGLEVSGVIGPYAVGASVSLECQVDSGRPRPTVSWYHEESLLDDLIEVKRGEVTSNSLTLPSLTRDFLYRVLTCQASNSNLSVPVAATVTLDMSFPPLDVRILGTVESLAEGERYAIVCESSGSRPTATITWWKDGMLMTDTKSQIFHEGNVSRSTLYLTPSLADHDAYVSCRAKNPMVPAAVMEDTRKLNVHYTPRLSLAAGLNLDMEDIKEGDDVYFECGIKANPRVFKVQWFHNGEELSHNVSAGVIQSNQSLVLQRVTRRSSGQYTCSATNLHGLGSSNAVQLSVKFAPMCRPGQKFVYGGGKLEELNITCSVEAHPDPTSFRWAFNSSTELVDIPSSKFWVVGNGKSQASYTPVTHLDYGSLLCWANNDVGRQLKPCIYHIIHACVGSLALTPILAVLLGVLASLLLMGLVIALVVRSRRPRPLKPEVKMVYDKGSGASVPLRGPEDSTSTDDHNPDLIPVNDDHQVKETQQSYTAKMQPVTDLHLQEHTPASSPRQQQSPSPQQHQQQMKEYLQGHDGSFYINPGTLLRQKGSLMTREADPMLHMGCPLAASSPAARTTASTQPTVSVVSTSTSSSGADTPESVMMDAPGSFKMSKPRRSASGSFKSDSRGSCKREYQGSFKEDYCRSSKKSSPGSFKLESSRRSTSGGSFKLEASKKSPSDSFKNASGSFKRETPRSPSRNFKSPSESFKLDIPGGMEISSILNKELLGTYRQEGPTNLKKESTGSFKLEIPGSTRRNSCGTFMTESPATYRRESSGSYKLDIPGSTRKGSCGSLTRDTLGIFRRESSGSFKLDTPGSARKGSSGSCKLHTPQRSPSGSYKSPSGSFKSPSGSIKKESPGSFKLETPKKSPSGSFKQESQGSFKLATPKKSPSENFRRDYPGSFKLETPKKSPTGVFKREYPGSFKLEAPKKSPSETFKRDYPGSFKLETPKKSPSENFKNVSGSFKLQTPQRSPSRSFKRESPGSFKLETPKKSPSGSFNSPSGSFKSPSGSFKLEAQTKSPSGSFKKESPGSLKLEMPETTRKGSSGSFKQESRGSIKLDTAGAVMMYSPGSKRRDILGNFKIDSSTEGALIVTQMSSPLHRPGSKPDKLRIVCPLDSKIRIELKMD
ncbi:muscle M-line assembly protein unc-89 isoform X2 [Procambarus clarkii]|uniref:muscle M-line assembly protein unc-89 isoform X2 n=1 Tax=Procambarus clarkii TaxID=6728 RepID=UPI0037422E6D